MIAVESYKQLKIPTDEDIRRGRILQVLRSPYLFWALISYFLITCMVIIYLKKQPVFSSEMALVLPGSGSSSSVQIDEVGSAKSQTKSPFSQASFNPRVNYKEMIKSRAVIEAAANVVGVSYEEFSMPKVLLTQQTSIIEVTLNGPSGSRAYDKTWALYNAFQDHLDQLRADEALRRDQSIIRVLDQYRERLNQTRKALIEFQQRALLISQDQLDQVMAQVSQLHGDILYAKAEQDSKQNQVNQLSYDLGVSPDVAGKAFLLQTDTQFMGHIKELDESAKLTSEYLSMWGRNHPKIKASEKRLKKAEQAAFKRAALLLGNSNANMLHSINLSASPERASLFRQLIDSYAQLKGLDARVEKMESSYDREQDRLKILAREAKELERLQRDHSLAEAVYTSAAADLEAGKADVFASYPVVQLLASPTEPYKKTSPSLKIAVLGALVGYIFVTAMILILWQRDFLISKLLNRS
ncbi:MAG: hypothetical protein MI867_27325 [Pseudomonadales bacterium]|nr:hypothetical protein [Pseudomonadales bacterium]